MNLLIVLREGDTALIGVFGTLILMSMLTWYLILVKSTVLIQQRRANQQFQDAFWNSDSISAASTKTQNAEQAPLARMAANTFTAMEQFKQRPRMGDIDEFLIRTLRNNINRESAKSGNGMTLLASVGSTAPFIGLFGTVWGIYHALIEISQSGNASMEMVAGPLGEALVATAAGLAAAIPAVLAYNAFQRANRRLREQLDGFAHDLHAFLMSSCEDNDNADNKAQTSESA